METGEPQRAKASLLVVRVFERVMRVLERAPGGCAVGLPRVLPPVDTVSLEFAPSELRSGSEGLATGMVEDPPTSDRHNHHVRVTLMYGATASRALTHVYPVVAHTSLVDVWPTELERWP